MSIIHGHYPIICQKLTTPHTQNFVLHFKVWAHIDFSQGVNVFVFGSQKWNVFVFMAINGFEMKKMYSDSSFLNVFGFWSLKIKWIPESREVIVSQKVPPFYHLRCWNILSSAAGLCFTANVSPNAAFLLWKVLIRCLGDRSLLSPCAYNNNI